MKVADLKFKVEGNQLVVAVTSESFSGGTERMLAVGGGVRARVFKTSEGKTVIQSFHFDRDRFDQDRAEKWLSKNGDNLQEAMHYVYMHAPSGSFEDLTLRVQRALNATEGCESAVVKFMFPDYIVCDKGGEYFKMPFTDEEGRITFGQMTKVELEFAVTESQKQNEKFERRSRSNCEIEEAREKGAIREADEKDEKREVVAVLIEAGTNYSKKRHYPKKTIQEAAGLFAGLKMYIDHPTEREDREKPERSVKDWVSTIKETWYEDGRAMGRLHVHDDWLWGKMKDPVFRESIGISINASGSRYFKTIDGEQMEVIERIAFPRSVDWVTESGARGRVEYLLESQQREAELKTLQTITLAEFQTSRKDLVEAIEKQVRESMKGETQEAVNKAVQEALKPYKEAEAKAAKESREKKVTALAEASRLPKKGIAAFVKRFLSEHAEVEEKDLEAKVKESVAAEIQYLADCGLGIKPGVDSQHQGTETPVQEAAKGLETRLGVEKIQVGPKDDAE